MRLRLKDLKENFLSPFGGGIMIVVVVLLLSYVLSNLLPRWYDDYKFNKSMDKYIDRIIAPPPYEKNAFLNITPDNILNVNPDNIVNIRKGDSVTFTYGYLDKTNNEHLNSAVTTVTAETPSNKKFKSINAKRFPQDFKEADTNEEGIYIVDVERKIKKTDGSYETLYKAFDYFFVALYIRK